MITLVVVFCLVQNPYFCRTMEMVPDDGHAIASQIECLKGGAVGGMRFMLEHAEWQTKGWRCEERQNVMQSWLRDRRR